METVVEPVVALCNALRTRCNLSRLRYATGVRPITSLNAYSSARSLVAVTRHRSDPVAPAKRSQAALDKALSHTLDDGTPVHSFATLLAELATIVRNTCRTPNAGADAPTFDLLTTPNPKQQRALELIQNIRV